MEAERQMRAAQQAKVAEMLCQKKGKKDQRLYNSTMEMMRVMAKQMHQKDMDQLPTTPLQMPMSATKENATQVEKSCGTRRNKTTLLT